jgi:antirestriction protein ArdC
MNKQTKTSKATPPPDRESLVRQAAYALYEQQGCVAGHELEHWIAAEALVDESLKSESTRPSRARVRDKAAGSPAH